MKPEVYYGFGKHWNAFLETLPLFGVWLTLVIIITLILRVAKLIQQ